MSPLGEKRLWAVAAFALALSAACGPAEEVEGLDQRRDPLLGGVVDEGDPNVFMLATDYPNGDAFICTSTLIGRRILLTAAHCVDKVFGADPSRIRATHLTVAPDWTATEGWLSTTAFRVHPRWDPAALVSTADVAVVQLTSAAPLKAKPLNRSAVDALVGAPVRVIGYGLTSEGGTGAGTKRQGTTNIRSLDPNNLNTGKICSGDSGGPTFHTFDDGVERQIGIHSYGQSESACVSGTDVRTDYYYRWIDGRLAELDADCGADGVCRQGCSPADVDCLCIADGACQPDCADKTLDPDCAEACVANGVCGTACASPDPDCSAPFQGCSSPDDCATRICESDPQSPGLYCTQGCTASGECPDGFECADNLCRHRQLPVAQPGEECTAGETFCAGGTVCTGPAGQHTTCQKRCFTLQTCDALCEPGQNGFRYCTPLLGQQPATTPDKEGGCGCASAASVAPLGLFAVGLAGLRRRRGA